MALMCAAIALIAFAACGKNEDRAPDQRAPKTAAPPSPERAAPAAAEPARLPEHTASLFAAHEVEDFAAWKEQFDLRAEARKDAGVVWHSVSRAVDDRHKVYVHLVGNDLAKLKTLAGAVTAGAEGESELTFANDVEIDAPSAQIDGETYSIIARHEVDDFDAWKPAFDGDAAARRDAMGVVAGSVSRVADQPNAVVVHWLVTDPDLARAALASDDAKREMAAAGVKGEPEIAIAKDVEMSSY